MTTHKQLEAVATRLQLTVTASETATIARQEESSAQQ